MASRYSPLHNCLLAALPEDAQGRLFPHLQRTALPLGKVLYHSGDALRYAYFPTDSIVSLLYRMENGGSGEISVVGYEGIVGVSLFMGGRSTSSQAIVQSAGNAYRLPGKRVVDEFNRHGEMLSLDRLQGNTMTMTQQLIANMLSVTPERVTEVASKLQKLGVITYRHGKITVRDRPTLEKLTCECYAVVRGETDRLLTCAPSRSAGAARAPRIKRLRRAA